MTDPRILKMTINEVYELALRQLESDARADDGGKRIAEIKSRLEKTDGLTGWYRGVLHGDVAKAITIGPFEADDHYEDTICEVWDGNYIAENNADFIANAPADIAYLLRLATI